MGAPTLRITCEEVTVHRDFFGEFPEFLKLNERARKVAWRNAKSFPRSLRFAYFKGFVEGATGFVMGAHTSAGCQVAYICGGIDGSAWA